MYSSLFCGRHDAGVDMRLRGREAIVFAALAAVLVLAGVAPGGIVASRLEASRLILDRRVAPPAPVSREAPGEHSRGSGARGLPSLAARPLKVTGLEPGVAVRRAASQGPARGWTACRSTFRLRTADLTTVVGRPEPIPPGAEAATAHKRVVGDVAPSGTPLALQSSDGRRVLPLVTSGCPPRITPPRTRTGCLRGPAAR